MFKNISHLNMNLYSILKIDMWYSPNKKLNKTTMDNILQSP
jgi:hypothetical protein